MIQNNIEQILDQIKGICEIIGRDPSKIVLIGVTKFANISQIKEAMQSGLMHIGENRVQEARKKFPSLEGSSEVTRHMIGHLQTNKVKYALEIFDFIQSVDSLKLANSIEEHAAKTNKIIDILVQVNTAGEEQKFGVTPTDIFGLISEISKLKHIRLLGLMTIAPLVQDKEIIRKCFRNLRFLRDQISERFSTSDLLEMKYLSMGMTDDFEIALEEGSNMVRIGRAIFQ